MNNEIAQRLKDLNLKLPAPSMPKYSYEPVTSWGGFLYVSGQIPRVNGVLALTGAVGAERSIEEGIEAAELCALNVLAQVEKAVGLDRVQKLVKVNGYVSSAGGFHDQPTVVDGASKLFVQVLGIAGRHARTALGVSGLPADALVEVEAVFGIAEA
ncbi:MAG TPA: RidA family protein [Candidatus Sulfotelmatobacter sp.]|nr:RidA family protein [Candidatus Sulfotelmatobacter sp.]